MIVCTGKITPIRWNQLNMCACKLAAAYTPVFDVGFTSCGLCHGLVTIQGQPLLTAFVDKEDKKTSCSA